MTTKNFTVKNGLSTGNIVLDAATGNATVGNLIGPHANGNSNITIASNANISHYVAGNVTSQLTITGTGANIPGYANVNSLSVMGTSNLGSVGNVIITGGSSGQYLQTNGTGVLTWATVPTSNSIANGTSNVLIPVSGGNVNTSVGGVANVFVVTSTGVNVAGTLNTGTNNANVGNLNATSIVYANNIMVIGSNQTEGGQLVLGYVGINNITGQANGTWNMDVDGSNNFRLFSKNATGTISAITMAAYSANNNVVFAGNVSAGYFIGNGSQLTGITVSAGSSIVNGTSNVSIPSSGENINMSVGGTANVVTVSANTLTASIIAANNNGNGTNFKVGDDAWIGDINVADTMSIQGQENAANGYIIFGNADATSKFGRSGSGPLSYTGAMAISANITTPQFISNVATGTAPFVVTSTTQVANLNVATSGTAGTVTTNTQPNITSVGTLTSLAVTGNISGANVTANLFGNGAAISSITGANVTGTVANATYATTAGTATSATTAGTVTTNAQPNITSVGTLTSLNVSGSSIVGNGVPQSPPTGSNILANATFAMGGNGTNYLTVGQYDSGNNYAMWMQAGFSNAISAPYNIVMQPIGGKVVIGNVANNSSTLTVSGTLSVTGNANVGNLGTTGLISATGNVAGGNVTTGGNVVATGNVSGGNVAASTTVYSFGTITAVGNANVGNLTTPGQLISTVATGTAPFVVSSTTQVANLSVATAGSATTAGTVTANAQPNITSVGTLTSLAVTGNISAANVTANLFGNGAAISSITGANVTGTVANATYATSAGSATTAGTVTTNAQPNITSVGTLTSLSVTGNATVGNLIGPHANGNSNVNIPAANGNINLTAGGNVTLVVTPTGANITGTLNTGTGNANVGNIGATNVVATLVTGTLTTAAQPNITSVGTLASLTVTGNTNSGNVIAGNITASGGILAANVTANAGGFFAGSGFGLTSIPGANVTGTLSIPTTSYAATVSSNAQSNITSVGTLTSLTVSGLTTHNANVAMGNNYITSPTFLSYKEYVSAVTISTSTQTLDLSTTNIFNLTLSSNTTLTFTNPPASGTAYSFMLYCKQDATGSRTITWPASVKWPNSSVPTLSTGANKLDILNFFTLDGGTTYVGALSLANVG